jgi:uncharacterized protein
MTGRLALAVTLLAVAAGCATPTSRAARAPHVIAVTGRGEVSVRPDTALVRLGAESRRPTLDEATMDVAQRMTTVLERVKALGVSDKDVATVRYAVEPLQPPAPRSPDGGDPARIVGYRVSNVVQLKVRDVAAAGRVVDAAAAAGANVIQGVSFTLEDRAAAEAAARARAVASAQRTASELARAAGVGLGRLLSLEEGVAARPLADGFAVARSTVGPGPIEAGELQVVVTVEARYAID